MLFTKIMQTSGKRACSCLPECSLFPQRYIKILSYNALPFFFRICNNTHRPAICIYMYSFSHVFVYVLCQQKNCHTYSMVENESSPPCMNALM